MDVTAHTGFRDRRPRHATPLPTGCVNPGERKGEERKRRHPIRNRRDPSDAELMRGTNEA
jgi:hypothetical protein